MLLTDKQRLTLLDKLMVKQGYLSDRKFTDILGTSQQLWQLTRTGKSPISMTILKRVAKTYPELAMDVLEYLGFDVSLLTSSGDLTGHDESYQNGNLRRLWHRLRGYFKS